MKDLDQREIQILKKKILKAGSRAIPVLIDVMKKNIYPDKNRWMATFLLGKISGVRSAPFISRFLEHPHWMMKTASLKTLLALKQKNYEHLYAQTLFDNSLIVRLQALENIKILQLKKLAPTVWKMLYDSKNYNQVTIKGVKRKKRAGIIKKIITTIGELEFKQATLPLLKMSQGRQYDDIFNEIEFSLIKITGKRPPPGNKKNRRLYWTQMKDELKESNFIRRQKS